MVRKQEIQLVYLHSMTFPNNEANAFDAVWTASALQETGVDTTFVMKSLVISHEQFLSYYYIPGSKLNPVSLRPGWLPERILAKQKNYFADLVRTYLRFTPRFAFSKKQKILYMRDPRLLRYFGMLREKSKWLRNWFLVYESHDPFGYDPNVFLDRNPFEDDTEIIRAAANFDLILTNSQALSVDIEVWTNGEIKPKVITLASPLERLKTQPVIKFEKEILLGYIGTIDKLRGVDILINALRYLPANFRVRVVGRFRREYGVDPSWLLSLSQEESIKDRLDLVLTDHIKDVAEEIDRCDIVVQTASHDVHDSKYATPQKAFGYMVRGKPILVGDVQGHKELFEDGVNALYYQLNPKSLAERAIYLVSHAILAQRIATGAWEQSANYSFARRAQDILAKVTEVTEK